MHSTLQRCSMLVGALTAFVMLGATPPELSEKVTRMAKIGRAGSPSFSPDGKHFGL
jgi:hypothetical protein